MKSYLITYDLKNPNRNYDGLHNAIKGLGHWWHYLESTWIIKTNNNLVQIQNALLSQIDQNDRLLVIQVVNQKTGWLTKDAWDWINQNVGQ